VCTEKVHTVFLLPDLEKTVFFEGDQADIFAIDFWL